MTYYCELVLDSCPDGGYIVRFPDIFGIYTQGDDKTEALAMAQEALNCHLDGSIEENIQLSLPVNRSDEGLFPIEVDKDIAKRILTSKIEALQNVLKSLETL